MERRKLDTKIRVHLFDFDVVKVHLCLLLFFLEWGLSDALFTTTNHHM
jgi:hypothetical protein